MKTCCLWSRTAACASLLACALASSLPHRLSAQEPRLANLSTLAQAGTGANVLTAGFVIGPGPDKKVLIRAIGPTLGNTPFRLTGVLADPQLTLTNGAGAVLATNDNWSSADAATMAAVGAFALPAGSKDSAIVTILPSGSYTAQVTGAANGTGLALVEVYEADSSGAKLVNLSTWLQIASGFSPIIGFVVSPGSGTRRFLARAAGPALSAFGLTGTLSDPAITLSRTSGTAVTVASNNDWGSPADANAASGTTLASAFDQFGAFGFPAGSKDSAILTEIGGGNYGIQVSGAAGTSGVAIVEVYDTTQATPPVVTIAATKASADESGTNNGEFTLTRTGDTLSPLTVSYGVGGSAVNGFDYSLLSGTVTFPAGASTVKLPVLVIPDLQTEGTDSVVVTLTGSVSYAVGAQNSATVSITDSPATLYIATLRPATGASGSTSSGTATILLAASGTVAGVNVSFSNLSSGETSAHLVIGANQDFVFNLGPGQINGALWTFTPTGTYTSTDLINALKSGNISVRIDSANYPSGETTGSFIQGAGAQAFTPPAAPPAVSLTGVTAADAARFLTQATFGPKQSEIDALAGSSIDAWITTQMALPFTSHRTAILADQSTYGGSGSFTNWNAITLYNRQAAWFKTVLTAPDQLRQRVAFALSEIFVISDVSLGNDNQTEPLANYYDLLGNGAFGNFRTLLENVTLSPMMGNYLSSLRNSKADPTTGQTPDENYAREVMQLFTIGLSMLQPDGTLQLGTDGLPIATYNQSTVTEMAKVFTGWSYFGTTQFRSGGGSGTSLINPMILFPANHDNTAKNLNLASLSVIPADSSATSGTNDLKLALDALVNHPNTGPFIAKLLIQRLVTSNPSPAYVYRVAQKFANNGSGVRGDLGAVVRAILTDYEARSPVVAANVTFGRLKEPLLRLTNLLRSFNASSTSGRYVGLQYTVNGTVINGTTPLPALATSISALSASTRLDNTQSQLDEAALRSPTVFNFFHPGYVLPGALASAGLVAPEYEITDATFSIDVPNFLRTYVFAAATGAAAAQTLTLDLTAEQAQLGNLPALLDHLGAVLCQGNLPQATRDRVTAALAALPSTTTPLERAQSAVLVVLTSPAAATQK